MKTQAYWKKRGKGYNFFLTIYGLISSRSERLTNIQSYLIAAQVVSPLGNAKPALEPDSATIMVHFFLAPFSPTAY